MSDSTSAGTLSNEFAGHKMTSDSADELRTAPEDSPDVPKRLESGVGHFETRRRSGRTGIGAGWKKDGLEKGQGARLKVRILSKTRARKWAFSASAGELLGRSIRQYLVWVSARMKLLGWSSPKDQQRVRLVSFQALRPQRIKGSDPWGREIRRAPEKPARQLTSTSPRGDRGGQGGGRENSPFAMMRARREDAGPPQDAKVTPIKTIRATEMAKRTS